mmetsp:Transcript_28700/g.32822  ORF Transcript_28700/g.32822 Transcript_28700/m.32822 type:complete len:648 (-) Transcript_28700:58-2001(-)
MNRFWMISTLIFGSIIALGRNIHVTLDLYNVGINEGIKEGLILYGAPSDVAPRLRRALQEDNSHLDYHFIYFDEESLSRERALLRDEDTEVLLATNALFELANKILDSSLKMNSSSGKYKIAPLAAPISSNEVAAMQKNTTLLGLAYFFTGQDEYAEQAIHLVRRWFLSPHTKIDPQSLYDSALHNQLHSFLDSLQMVLGHLEDPEIIQLQEWFLRYLEYMGNNFITGSPTTHSSALYFDIEQLALSHFVGDEARQAEVFKRVLHRLSLQIEKDGSLPQELAQKDQCEHSQILTLQGWWTLARLFSNAMGETLWTAEDEAMCRASEFAVPYFRERQRCGSSKENDKRWWPIIVDALRYCPNLKSKTFQWLDWMSPDSREIPSNHYAMPPVYEDTSVIPLFWNLGMPVKKEVSNGAATQSETKDPNSNIPMKLIRASEHDSQMAQRVHRIKRWHELGQKEIADRMTKKAIKDLRSTKIIMQNRDFIPSAMLDAAQTDQMMNERIGRIRRWYGLEQHSIVERMIKKSMDELQQKAEDDAAVKVLAKREEQAFQTKPSIGNSSFISSSSSLAQVDKFKSNKVDNVRPAADSKIRKTSSMEIPSVFIEQAKTDPEMRKRIHRIQRWKRLNQHEIADKMIKKLLASTEDQTF